MAYERLQSCNIDIEFGSELLKSGPAKHIMCYDLSGVRIELFWNEQ